MINPRLEPLIKALVDKVKKKQIKGDIASLFNYLDSMAKIDTQEKEMKTIQLIQVVLQRLEVE